MVRQADEEVMSIVESGNHLPRILAHDSRNVFSMKRLPHHDFNRLVANFNDSDFAMS